MRAALYARVSSEEQVEGYSIDAQRRAYGTLLKGRGWTDNGRYIEEGKSARTDDIDKRPAFKEMMGDALSGKFDVLVVHKLDRFSRNLRITLEYFDKLVKAEVAFVSINEQTDFTTPSGKVHLALVGAFAQYYSDNLSQETKKGWHERRRQGLYCGTLPFGAMKGEDGIPIPDMQERMIEADGKQITIRNYEGLKMASDLAAQGKSDRDGATALNALGYRTTGTHGSRPFTKDTLKDMLNNRFYIGYIPDGNGGWIKAKHSTFIGEDTFNQVQELRRQRRRYTTGSVRSNAQTYSLSGLVFCKTCGSRMAIHMGHNGKPRMYCRGRAEGKDCQSKLTFLEVYERQVEWYLQNFVVPDDYKERILEAHRKLRNAYPDPEKQQRHLQNRLQRIKDQFELGHIEREEYLRKYDSIQKELLSTAPKDDEAKTLGSLARFMNSVADAWGDANQEQRNKLAGTLFEDIRVENSRVVAVKPREELKTLFQLSYDEHLKSSRVASESPRGRHCNVFASSMQLLHQPSHVLA